jgi:hypothetical protein
MRERLAKQPCHSSGCDDHRVTPKRWERSSLCPANPPSHDMNRSHSQACDNLRGSRFGSEGGHPSPSPLAFRSPRVDTISVGPSGLDHLLQLSLTPISYSWLALRGGGYARALKINLHTSSSATQPQQRSDINTTCRAQTTLLPPNSTLFKPRARRACTPYPAQEGR